MTEASPANGTVREIDGKSSIFFDGYWIRRYQVPSDEAVARRELIDQLTKRVFHHTEPGINTPGYNLQAARVAYETETDNKRKRVNAAMLAGALLNRGSDIFGSIFELRRKGIEITQENELMLECESCFLEAFDLGKQVLHYSGEEGLDELWGEPLKAFNMPVTDFYESRYIKIAQTMAAIDEIAIRMLDTFADVTCYEGVGAKIENYAAAAKAESETVKSDPAIFGVWPAFVTTGDDLAGFSAQDIPNEPGALKCAVSGVELIHEGKRLIEWIAFARVPMPKSTGNFFARCDEFKARWNAQIAA
ncbi:MAG: hypothetical protein AAF384_10760 [Pseudomonadota bacterium]